MITAADYARADYELRRSAAHAPLIHATVTVNARGCMKVYPATGISAGAIDASARERYGDEPVGVTVIVR